eukprot:g26323.t1
MLEAFQAKFPKLKDAEKSVRALKKLEKQASALKHVLSANKEGLFRVESLYEDTDFAQQVTREELESWTSELIYFTDMTTHRYDIVLVPLNTSQPHEDGWTRGVELFPAFGKLKAKKTVKMNVSFDLKATLLENGNPVFDGIHAASEMHADLPLISLKFDLDGSGVVQVSSATAIFDKLVPVKSMTDKDRL